MCAQARESESCAGWGGGEVTSAVVRRSRKSADTSFGWESSAEGCAVPSVSSFINEQRGKEGNTEKLSSLSLMYRRVCCFVAALFVSIQSLIFIFLSLASPPC